MKSRLWTDAEVALLWKHRQSMTAKELARSWLPGRSPGAIWDKAKDLGILKHRRYIPALPSLADEIAAAKRERATAPPYKSDLGWIL